MIWAKGQSLQGGKYIIEKVLGQGGFGTTYKALHVSLKQQVVIKTPNEHLRHDPDYQKFVERFVNEAVRLAKLSEERHPHIVRVSDLFQEQGIYCLVMDFISGENLFELVRRRGALPEAEALKYIRQIGEALAVVHRARLVHRDAHPGNIMLLNTGKAILIDFGIAGEIVPTTVSSTHFANPAFAPYEQMNGSREPTVDIYCLSASLYYAVTGQRPATALDRKLNNVPLVAPKRLKPSISDWLNQAILQGMALEARERPQSMQALLQRLQISASLPRSKLQISSAKAPVASASVSPRKQTQPISWRVLTVALLWYVVLGSIFSLFSTPLWIVTSAVVVISAGAVAGAVTGVPGLMAGAIAAEAAVISTGAALALNGFLAVVSMLGAGVNGAVSIALAVVIEDLFNSFGRFQTFLILAGIGPGGLGLGWLLGAKLRLMGVVFPAV